MNKILLSLLLLVASLPAFAAPALTAAQEARVQELVQETLLKHPEILAEAYSEYEKNTGGSYICPVGTDAEPEL